MWLDLAYAIPIAALIVVLSALFAGTEVAVFSLRRVDRDQMSRSGRQADKSVLALLALPRRLVTAVMIGVEALLGLLVVLVLGIVARAWPDLAAQPGWHALATLAITLPLVVLFGEILPKALALKNPIGWSRVAAWPLAMFALAVSPVRWVVQAATAVLVRPLVDPDRPRPTRDLSEEEFKSLVDAGSAQGQVDARERRLIHRVFEFGDKNVGQIMTPRERMVALAYDLPMARLAKEVAARGFSRVPIYQKTVDNIRGILNAKDLVRVQAGVAAGRTLGELLHDPLFVPRTTPIKRLFLTFKQKKVHMGIVVNEYGKVLGLVTMDDVLAQLFGALRDERDALQARSTGAPIKRAGAFAPSTPGAIDTGPVARVEGPDAGAELAEPAPVVDATADDGAAAEPAREPAELTPPEHTPPPHAVPAIIAALATSPPSVPPEDDPALAPRPLRPSALHRAMRRPEPRDDTPVEPEASDATPVPITDSDTGPSGPVSARRSR